MYLSFFNHNIFIGSNKKELFDKIQEEFLFFLIDKPLVEDKIFFHFHFLLETPPPIPPTVSKKILDNVIIYEHKKITYLDYQSRALSLYDKTNNEIKIYSEDFNELFELAYLSIHSIVGKKLEKKGITKVHALGVSKKRYNALIMLPSGGGKSTLLTQLLSHQEIKIISDDSPFVDIKGRVHSFPGKLSLKENPKNKNTHFLKDHTLQEHWHQFRRYRFPPKWTYSLSRLKDRIEMKAFLNTTYLIAGFRLSDGPSKLKKVNKCQMIIPLLEHMVFGVGLPQIIELFLNFNLKDLIQLPYHFTLRLVSAFQLLRKSQTYYFYMGKNLNQNTELILDLFNEDN